MAICSNFSDPSLILVFDLTCVVFLLMTTASPPALCLAPSSTVTTKPWFLSSSPSTGNGWVDCEVPPDRGWVVPVPPVVPVVPVPEVPPGEDLDLGLGSAVVVVAGVRGLCGSVGAFKFL